MFRCSEVYILVLTMYSAYFSISCAGVAVPSAVERKELQQFPVVKEVSLLCQVGSPQLCVNNV